MEILIPLLIMIAGGAMIAICLSASSFLLSSIGVALIIVGALILLSKLGVCIDDVGGVAAAIFLIYLAIMIIKSIDAFVWKVIGIVVLILVVLAAAGFVAWKLLRIKNKLIAEREKVTQEKSKVRIAKHKYLTALRKINEIEAGHLASESEAIANANRGSTSRVHGATGDLGTGFAVGAEAVRELADQLAAAQNKLVEAISAYNVMISSFPTSVAAKIFKFEKEKNIDEENLDKSTELQGFDESEL